MLSNNFQQRLGSALNEKQSARLERALEHYMSEVIQANPGVPVQTLNKEVLQATAADFRDYIQRQNALAEATPQMFQETSQRFDQIQQTRQRALEAPRPAVPEYVQPIQIKEDDSVSALQMFEEAKKRRNMEMSVQAEEQKSKRTASASTPLYLQDQQQLTERPDPRSLYDRPLDLVVAGQDSMEPSGRADGNSTIARATVPASLGRGTLAQDLIIKQQDIQSYKETEYNLSVYSADRKWEFDTSENRYNFSVNLYSGNPTTGVSVMPKATARFRNIVRIEFVKAVMPIENTDMIVRKTASEVYDTSFLKNIFGYPFITLNIDELDTNTYGTSNTMDNAFGILQYDANWTDNTDSMGFTSYIPKHMKCQRIYAPTPLSTLNKLTIRLQQPNGSLVNSSSDTLDISGISMSCNLTSYIPSSDVTNTVYTDTNGEYIWIDSKTWFSRFQMAAGDRIQIRKLTLTNPTPAQADLLNFLQDPNGHMIVGTAYTYQESVTNYADGHNSAGYSRFIILRARFNDPTTGSTTVAGFGGESDNSSLSLNLSTSGRLINLSHQTQLIFRIVTRDYDSTALIRPDNL